MLLFLLSTGIFIFRGSLLRHIADKRITRLEQRYGLDISYNKLHMKGLNTISIDGLNVVPQKRDIIAFPSISQYPYRSLETAVGRYQDQRSPPGRTLTQFHKKRLYSQLCFLFLPSPK